MFHKDAKWLTADDPFVEIEMMANLLDADQNQIISLRWMTDSPICIIKFYTMRILPIIS